MISGKKVFRFFIWILLFAGACGILWLAHVNAGKQRNEACDHVEISISNGDAIGFLDDADIRSWLVRSFGDSVEGDRIQYLNTARIEDSLEKNPYIRQAEAYIDASGELHLRIDQKQPLARVINKYGVNYYVDDVADKIPLSSKFTCRVPVITGNIEETYHNAQKIQSPVLENALGLVRYIHANTFWDAQIEQIAVTDDGEFELVPKVGDQVIQFGTADNMQEKFDKLGIFYKEGLRYVGWDKYKNIDLRFDRQVVCK